MVEEVTSSLTDGQYGPGQMVDVFVKYDAPVAVIGTPRLQLDLGDGDSRAEYKESLGGANGTLRFVYVVREGAIATELSLCLF